MIRLLILLVFAVLVAISLAAGALYYFLGWKGLLAVPLILIAAAWLGKFLVKSLFQRFALGLFSMKSAVLRGAQLKVHSVEPGMKPRHIEEFENSNANDSEENTVDDEEEKPQHYVDVDLTMTPGNKGRDGFWEPSELMLTQRKVKSLSDLEDDDVQLGSAEQVLIWDGSNFVSDDPGKYPGEQRLKITFSVTSHTPRAWLHYYNEPIGEIDLPPAPIEV